MPRDYQQQDSLFRVKVKVGGMWVDDINVLDPAVALPATIASADPATRLAWQMTREPGARIKVKVTFRRDDGTEVAGTYTAKSFVIVPPCNEEQKLGATRATIESNPPAVAGTSTEPMIVDDLGDNDVFGVLYSDIAAGDATHMFVRMEEVA